MPLQLADDFSRSYVPQLDRVVIEIAGDHGHRFAVRGKRVTRTVRIPRLHAKRAQLFSAVAVPEVELILAPSASAAKLPGQDRLAIWEEDHLADPAPLITDRTEITYFLT